MEISLKRDTINSNNETVAGNILASMLNPRDPIKKNNDNIMKNNTNRISPIFELIFTNICLQLFINNPSFYLFASRVLGNGKIRPIWPYFP
jgi:hypothetical protein